MVEGLQLAQNVGEVFQHFKGGRYVLIAVAHTHEHNGDRDAVYVALRSGEMFTRPYVRDSRKQAAWCDVLEWPDGQLRQRFTLVRDL